MEYQNELSFNPNKTMIMERDIKCVEKEMED